MEIPCSSSFESLSGFDLEIGLSLSSYSRSMALEYGASRSFPSRHNPHFLDSCSLCTKLLGVDHDIYMYMGNTPFCSEECRTKQIEIDEANERRRRMQRKKMKAEDNNNNKKSCSTSSKSNDLYITVTIAG